jgi:hypothetical protein
MTYSELSLDYKDKFLMICKGRYCYDCPFEKINCSTELSPEIIDKAIRMNVTDNDIMNLIGEQNA